MATVEKIFNKVASFTTNAHKCKFVNENMWACRVICCFNTKVGGDRKFMLGLGFEDVLKEGSQSCCALFHG